MLEPELGGQTSLTAGAKRVERRAPVPSGGQAYLIRDAVGCVSFQILLGARTLLGSKRLDFISGVEFCPMVLRDSLCCTECSAFL